MSLFQVETLNEVLGNTLYAIHPWAFTYYGPDSLGPSKDGETHFALEAWERQTTGGLKVPCLPGYPYAHAVSVPVRSGHTGFTRHFMSADGRTVIHEQYINAAY
jgi:hypothetical protein